MKSNRYITTLRPLCAAAMAAFSITSAFAEAKLKVGDAAPPLKVGEWIQGEAIKEFSRDNVYVVEFWATWCGPCVATIPHLDELHEELKDKNIVFIGQNCREDDMGKVKKFVEKMGEKMSYRVASDDASEVKDGYMTVNWFNAAEQPGIPSAFVVGKDGKIAWIGHPQLLNADMLKEISAGTFDSKKAAKKIEDQQSGLAVLMAKAPLLNAATEEKDWPTALKLVDEMEAAVPEMAPQLAGARFAIGIEKGDDELVNKYSGKFFESDLCKDTTALNVVARNITIKVKNPSEAALSAAEKAITMALDRTKRETAPLLDTRARVEFLQGKKEEAVKTQEKALSLAGDGEKEEMSKALESYKGGELPAAEPVMQ